MKKFFSTSLVAMFFSVSGHAVLADGNAVLVQAPVEKMFIPLGFDDNDKVEIILHGHFANSCYKMGPVSATVDTDSKKISITAEAYFYAGAICREMIVGFTKAVELPSHVRPGSYDVVMTGNTAAPASKLLIGRSTRLEADDYLYASAHSIDVTTPFVGGAEIVLRGQHPHVFQGCVKFVETKTSISEDVIVVQPITRISNDDSECAGSVNNRFEERVEVPALTRGEYVVHVRTLDGNSLNHFFIAE